MEANLVHLHEQRFHVDHFLAKEVHRVEKIDSLVLSSVFLCTIYSQTRLKRTLRDRQYLFAITVKFFGNFSLSYMVFSLDQKFESLIFLNNFFTA